MMVKRILVFLLSFSLLFPQFLSFSVKPVFAVAKTHDMSSPSSYNLRFDGGSTQEFFPTGQVKTADLDGDNKLDILASGSYADNNSRANSGSVYVIYGSLLETFSGTGNNLDLSSSSNYNLRFDGVGVGVPFGDLLGDWSLSVADINNDGKQDILIGAMFADNNSRDSSGSLYIIYNDLFRPYTGTGNNIDLAVSSNYSLRYDGAVAGDALTFAGVFTGDLDNDGKKDILVSAESADKNSRTDSGSLYVIYNTLIDDYSGTGNQIDLANSSNYNLRYDGAAAGDGLSMGAIGLGDLDNDGKQDILMGAPWANNNSRTDSGSLYVIYNSLIDNYAGTGNNIDLANSSNYNLRYDGAATNDFFTWWTPVYPADVDNDNKLDLLVGSPLADNNSRADSGSLYVVFNNLIDNYSGSGNNIDLANSANYNLRYDGATATESLGDGGVVVADLDNVGGNLDILVGASYTDFNSRTDSGSLYVIYNFPHAVSATALGSSYTTSNSLSVSGTVAVSASSTTTLSASWEMSLLARPLRGLASRF